MEPRVEKVIWAVDAFAEDTVLQRKLINELSVWTKNGRVEIEPVMLLAPTQLGVSVDFFLREMKKIEAEATERILKISKKTKTKNVLPPKVLFCNSVSLRAGVKTLLDYALQSKADLIAVSSQSRKRVNQFLFGSFAETLILNSEIPVYVVTPKSHLHKPGSPILFATDFSEKSDEAFLELLSFARHTKQKVIIYNRLEYATMYSMSTFDSLMFAELREKDGKERTQKLKALVSKAKAYGVNASSILDEKSRSCVYEAILLAAKKNHVSSIAMASQTGAVVSNLLGSITRQVVRAATCPVWVLHATARKSKKIQNQSSARLMAV